MKYITLILALCLTIITGCGTPGPTSQGFENDQLTSAEETLLADKATALIQSTKGHFKLTSIELKELRRTKPSIRAYCGAYKHGRISISWTLKNGKFIKVNANGYLLDEETPLQVKVSKTLSESTDIEKVMRQQYQ